MATRDLLRIMISISLSMVKRSVRADYARKETGIKDPAQQKIADTIAERLELVFDITPKEKEPAPGYCPKIDHTSGGNKP